MVTSSTPGVTKVCPIRARSRPASGYDSSSGGFFGCETVGASGLPSHGYVMWVMRWRPSDDIQYVSQPRLSDIIHTITYPVDYSQIGEPTTLSQLKCLETTGKPVTPANGVTLVALTGHWSCNILSESKWQPRILKDWQAYRLFSTFAISSTDNTCRIRS